MFVDVSRYTALVEQLANRGQEGLEKIPRLLTASYAHCTRHVADHEGEVLCFAGDSLLAYWPADRSDLGSAVRSAIGCARAICDRGKDAYEDALGEIKPDLHIGIGAGPLWLAALGGPGAWNLVAGGEAIADAAGAQAAARSWSYVVSESATSASTRRATVTGVALPRDGERPADGPPRDWLTGFLSPQIRELLKEPARGSATAASPQAIDPEAERQLDLRLAALNEIRPASSVFAQIDGLDHRDPDALSQHHAVCVALQDILRERGGPPGDLFYGDKGLVFSATFGSRGHFHRDDPIRAVDTARAIALTVERLGLSSSVGVATGDALFCFVGNFRHRQWMVHGSSVNRASRLMTAASNGVLCDAPTERASRSIFEFEERGALQLAGLGDMAAIFRPLQLHATASPANFLIGRQSELEILRRTLEEARGSKRLLVVLGESGIGKTSLVGAFADELRAAGTAVSLASVERDDQRTSLLPWRRLFASLLGLAPNAEGQAMLAALDRRVATHPAIAERLPLLGGFLGIDIPDSPSTRHLEGAHRADATMRLMGDLLAAVAPRPSVLVLEDSQWLDSASWRLVEWVLAGHSSMLIVLCVRSEEIPEELKSLQHRAEAARLAASAIESDDPARFCRILDLKELSDASIRELVARTLGDTPPQMALADRISKLASGSPLFAEEITLTLKAEGLIAIRDGFWRSISPLEELRYFGSVDRVIRERIDRIGAKMLDVLKACAVIGRSFTTPSLQAVLEGQSNAATSAALESLVAAQFVRESSAPGSYEFRHDRIRDVVYDSIAAEIRQRLHLVLAEWLEMNQLSATGADIASLAQHFEAAGNMDKAVEYAEMAAAKALEVGAFREVEAFLSICLSHEPRHNPSFDQRRRSVRWRILLAEAHNSRGDIRAQGVAVRRALTLAGERDSRWPIVIAVRLAGSALRLLSLQRPSRSTGVAASAQSWEREMARCHNQAAVVDYFELRFLHGMRHLIEAVAHAERAGITQELAVTSSGLACGLGIMGQRRLSEYFMRKAERVAIALADPALHSHVCYMEALWRIGHCHWEIVDQRLAQSQELSSRAGDQLRWSHAQAIRFWSMFYRGDWGGLEQAAQGLLSRAQNSGNIQHEIWALRCKSLCALRADRPRESVEHFRLITSAMLGSADLAVQISSKGTFALALARIGQHDESLKTVDETLRLLREMGRPTGHVTLVGVSGLCEVLLRGREEGLSREYDQWHAWESQALHEMKRFSRVFPVGKPQYRLWAGVSHWLGGHKNRAFAAWNQALADAQQLGLRQDEAMISAEIRRRRDRG